MPDDKRVGFRVVTDGQINILEQGGKLVGGANVTVAGSQRQGYAICNTCPQPDDLGQMSIISSTFPNSGACCLDDGTCSVTTSTTCSDLGGTYQGDGTDCDPNPCPQPTGACCVGTDCTIETEDDCTGMGGTYQGDDTTCDPNPCGEPTGACCDDNGCCTITTEEECTGSYQGDDTTCDPNPCFIPCGFLVDGQIYKTKTVTSSGTCSCDPEFGSYSSQTIVHCNEDDTVTITPSGTGHSPFFGDFTFELGPGNEGWWFQGSTPQTTDIIAPMRCFDGIDTLECSCSPSLESCTEDCTGHWPHPPSSQLCVADWTISVDYSDPLSC